MGRLLLILLMVAACGQPQEVSQSAILIRDVNLVDLKQGKVLEGYQVVVDSGIIKKVEKSAGESGSYQTVIEGKGQYLMPGLAEMHAHIPSPPTSEARTHATLFLYLSNGITTIRGMLGHPSHLQLREQVASGEVLGPRIFTSSPSLNGNTVPNPAEARKKVMEYSQAGYDFLKIHPGIELKVFDTLVKTAQEENIPIAGHVPVAVGIRNALESGYASIDHVDGFLEGLVPENSGLSPDHNGFFGFNFTDRADINRMDSLVAMARENEVWIVPTQSLFERWYAPADGDSLLQQVEMQYMPQTVLTDWKNRKLESTGPGSDFNADKWQDFIELRRQLIHALTEDGHGMLLGSDAPQLFNVPGFSIHHEIEALEKAGMSPLEILRSGTINPAVYFGKEEEFGHIAAGLAADLILIESDPLQDLTALRDISGVMVRGHWLSREEIDRKLEEVAAAAKGN